MALIFRAVKANKRVVGYQLAAYLDKPNARLQIVVANLSSESNWKFCADGVVLSKHKVTVRLFY